MACEITYWEVKWSILWAPSYKKQNSQKNPLCLSCCMRLEILTATQKYSVIEIKGSFKERQYIMKICPATDNSISLFLNHRSLETGCQKNSKCASQFTMFSLTHCLIQIFSYVCNLKSKWHHVVKKKKITQEPVDDVR